MSTFDPQAGEQRIADRPNPAHGISNSPSSDGASAGVVPAAASAHAVAHGRVPNTATPNPRQKTSVAVQQKMRTKGLIPAPIGMFPSVDYGSHTPDQLHEATVAALATYKQKREEADEYAYEVLIPALNQVIQNYKQPGRATPYRLNGCPTVKQYFESIGLNYSTVRSWKFRANQRLLQAAADAGTKPSPNRKPDAVEQLRKSDRQALIEAAAIGTELVTAIEEGGHAAPFIERYKQVVTRKRLDDILHVGVVESERDEYQGTLQRVRQNHQNHICALANQLAQMVIAKKSIDEMLNRAKRITRLYDESRQPNFFEEKARKQLQVPAVGPSRNPKKTRVEFHRSARAVDIAALGERKPDPPARSKVQLAEEWLRRYLKHGPMPIPDSFRKYGLCRYNFAPDALPPFGIGKKTIDTAILNLGIQKLPTGPRGGMRWHLPGTANATDNSAEQ